MLAKKLSVIIVMNISYLLCVKHCAKYFIYIIFSYENSLMKSDLLCQFHRCHALDKTGK